MESTKTRRCTARTVTASILIVVLLGCTRPYACDSVGRPPSAPGEIRTKMDEKIRIRIPLAKIPKTILLLKKLSPVPCPDSCEKLVSLIEKGAETASLTVVVIGITACLTHISEQNQAYNTVIRQFLKRNLNEYLTTLTREHGTVQSSMIETDQIDDDVRTMMIRLGSTYNDLLSPAANTLRQLLTRSKKEVALADLKLGIEGFIALLDVLESEGVETCSGTDRRAVRARLQSFREYVEKAELLAMSTLAGEAAYNREFFDFVPRVRIPTASVPRPQALREIDLTDTDNFDIDPLVEELTAAHVYNEDIVDDTTEKASDSDGAAQPAPTRQEMSTLQQPGRGATCSIPAPIPEPCTCPTGQAGD